MILGFGPDFWIGWLVGAGVVGLIAAFRNRGFLGYFITSVILSPLIGLIILLATGDGQRRVPCMHCKEPVVLNAAICPHCHSELTWEPNV